MQHRLNFLSKIPKEWLLTEGKDAILGIIDTNIIDKKYIIKKKIFGYNNNIKHSESVLGIIIDKNVKGLAEQTKVCFAGISTDDTTYTNFIEALKWIKDCNIDVLNLSLAYKHDIKEAFELLEEISKTSIVISAYSDKLNYPHIYDCVVSVGNKKNDNVDIIVETNFNRHGEIFKGTSMSCAFISSIACLAKSFDKQINKRLFLEQILGEKSIEMMTINKQRQYNVIL